MLEDDLVKSAVINDVDGAGAARGRREAQCNAVVVAAALVGDVNGPGREVGHINRVGPLAQQDAVDRGAGNAHFLPYRIDGTDRALADAHRDAAGHT